MVYRARGIAGLWTEPGERTPEALVRLLGRNRAAVLSALTEPATSRRYGHQVLYERTPLGVALTGAG